MSAVEQQNISQPHLQKQDLSQLDISKLTPLSPEVISRQATINVGTIGHVAHGKSTVVKAISGVQTVRFKNELERNITIKLERLTNETVQKLINSPEEVFKFQKELHEKYGPPSPVKKPRHIDSDLVTPDKKLKQSKLFEFYESTPSPDASGTKKQRHMTDYFKKPNELLLNNNSEYSEMDSNASRKRRRVSYNDDSLIEINDTDDGDNDGEEYDPDDERPSSKRKSNQPPAKQRKRRAYGKDKDEYVVEDIEEIGEIDFAPYFFVKWKGYSRKVNTWEKLLNVWDCERFQNFITAEFQSYHVEVAEIMELLRNDENYIEFENNYNAKTFKEKLKDYEQFDEYSFKSDLIIYAIRRSKNLTAKGKKIYDRLVSQFIKFKSYELRKKQQEEMNEFINNVNKYEARCKITIENNVDFDAPVLNNFTYINDNKAGEGVYIPTEAPLGCECTKCDNRSQCCGKLNESKMAYLSSKKLNVQSGVPIYECNSKCLCGPDCPNRVVQQGRKQNLTLFKTANNRGWGVKTNTTIAQGGYVAEYVGEVITAEEAEKRGEIYDAVGRTYLFDLDFFGDDNPYTIDAANYGNITRFINHSCDPNCGIWPVWIECLDPNLPRLAFFAKRRIEAGEELTFSYVSQVDSQNNSTLNSSQEAEHKEDSDDIKKNITECRCGAANCQKYVF